MRLVSLSGDRLDPFIRHCMSQRAVMAPRKKGERYMFDRISSPDEVVLEHIPTILPPKKYFMPQHETLLEFDTTHGQDMYAVVEVEPSIIFGVHPCDLAGLTCLGIVFSEHPKDMHYLVRKNEILLVGYECAKPCDSYASCGLMHTSSVTSGYDLLFVNLGNQFAVEIGTAEGEALVTGSGLFTEETSELRRTLAAFRLAKKGIFRPEVPITLHEIPKLFEETFNSTVWDDIGRRCLSCGNCTNTCPTCYCFDVRDMPDLSLTKGKRIRVWDSCQHEPFAQVAGGENFRERRGDRKRHRFNRKFWYPVKRWNRAFCTGCGRCSRNCMAGIDLKQTINALIEDRDRHEETLP